MQDGVGDIKRLESICRHTPHCLAFNTNAILKHSLHPPHSWIRWTEDADGGLYVLGQLFPPTQFLWACSLRFSLFLCVDVDYCKLAEIQCPAHSSCHQFSPGKYSCKCIDPWLRTPQHTCVKKGVGERDMQIEKGVELNINGGEEPADLMRAIHVIISCDEANFPGVAALLNSILTNTRSVQLLKIHVVLAQVTEEALLQYLHCFPAFSHLTLDMVQLDAKLLDGRVHVYSSEEEVGRLSSLGNFARFFFHKLFPDMKKALYLDADTIVKGDIAELWRQLETSEYLLLAAPR